MALTAARLDRINPSLTVAVRTRAAALAAEGRDILRVSSGEPDFDTPLHIKQAAIDAIRRGETKYTDVAGTRALRQAIVRKFRRDSGLDYDEREIIVGAGGKQIIFNALVATLDPGDEAIIPTPCWVSYPDIVGLAGGRPALVPTPAETGFRLRAQDLEAAITPRTKWLILNNPCNPTGAAYSVDDLRPLCDVLLRYSQIRVLTDDIYEKLAYGEQPPATVAQAEPRLRDRTLTMNGCSKTYAMTGWRIGYAGGPRDLIAAMDKLQSQSTSNASSVAQAAAAAALDGPHDFLVMMLRTYRERRDMVCDALNAAPGLRCRVPEGAFYVFPSMEACIGRTSAGGARITDDEAFVTALLDETGVAAVHGGAFMQGGHFRISYATATETLREACVRIRHFCDGLR
jgi:aspartate aminotransferase